MEKSKKDKYEKRAKEGKEQYEVDKKTFLESKGDQLQKGKTGGQKKGGD